jgi:hypothetical protein
MGLIDQLKLAGEQASSTARQSMQATQLRHELELAYGELGRATYALVEKGGLVDERLAGQREHIRDIERQLVALGDAAKDQTE